jgi:hypothetical protein
MPEGQAEWAERLAAALRPADDHLLRELKSAGRTDGIGVQQRRG